MTFLSKLSEKRAHRGPFAFIFVLSFLLLSALAEIQASGQVPTVVLNDQSVIQPTTKRVGLNLGSINYWDNGQMLKNLIGSINPGFEPLIDQQIWALPAAGTTTSFTDPDKWDGEPANYWAGGTFKVVASQTGGAEMGCTGTIASNTGPNYPTGTQTQPVFTLSAPCAAPLAAGDIVVLSQTFTPTPETWWETSKGGVWAAVSGGGKLTSDTTDLCATCGSQAITLDATATGSAATVTSYFDSAPKFDLFVLMNGTYQISFWAKTASGSPKLTVSASRLSAGGFDCGSHVEAITGTWSQYTISCTAAETAKTTTPGTAQVVFAVTGGAVYLDNTSFQKTNTDPTNTTIFRDEVVNALKSYYSVGTGGNGGMLRDWLGQNGETYANWTAPDYAHKPTSSGGGYMVGPGGSGVIQLSLEDYLNLCKALNAEPYFEVPVTITEQDSASLIDFLAGPSTSAGGQRRAALGQSAPWTSVFDQIHLSFCNECWNGTSFVGQSLPSRTGAPNSEYYYDYSVRAAAVFKAMRSNASYTEAAFDLVMGAQTGVSYTMDAAIQRAHPDSVELEDYTYENVSSFATDAALWQPDFVELYDKIFDPTDPSHFYQSVTDYKSVNACGASGTAVCGVNVYEWGSGSLEGTIDQKHLDYITAGAGTGVISALQPLLNMQNFGIQADSYFSLAEYQNNSLNGLLSKVWGIAVDMGGATNNMRPQALGISLINQSIIGPMYSCPISNNLTYNFAGSATNGTAVPPGVPATNAVPYLYSFCFESGGNRSMVLVNTDLTASHTVSFAGTNIPYGTVTERQYAPSSPDLLNESPTGTSSNISVAAVALTSATLSNPTSITLPPMSATALDFVSGHSTVAGQAATPTFSLASGSFTSAQTVAISDASAGATIYYTTDGSTPSTSSTVYTAPIAVSSTKTIKAIAAAASYTNSAVASATYTIVQVAATPVISVAAGSYSSVLSVSISDTTPGATIYYTTNGATPTSASSVYTGAISIATTETLQAIAVASGYTNSGVATATYTLTLPALAPTFSPPGGTYSTAQVVTISDLTPGASILYTTDGTTPSATSAIYTGPVTVASTKTLKAVAVLAAAANSKAAATSGYVTSPVSTAAFTINTTTATPTFSVASGTYTGAFSVSLSDATAGAVLHYTTDGSTPTAASKVYSGAITVGATETLKAIAIATGYANSAVAIASYTILVPAAAPAFSVAGGTYASAQTVKLTDATAAATIYYTTNGSAPTTASTVYSSPISVSVTETIKAIAIATGYTSSAVSSAAYTIQTSTTSINGASGFAALAGKVAVNGYASLTGTSAELTNGGLAESGSAWYKTPMSVTGFTTDFTFQQTNATGDGMTFAIENNAKNIYALGGNGASLGYGGITNSVGVKFDLFSNAGEGPDSTGLYLNGATPTVPAVDMSASGVDLHKGDVMAVHIVYDGTTLTMTITDTVTKAAFTTSWAVNIPAAVGGNTAYVGFTGGSGSRSAVQQVLTWTYTSH
jgi:hypothetical protein